MKTAMQELIQFAIENAFNITDESGVRYVVIDYEEMKLQFDNLLEKEKQQIIEAHNRGQKYYNPGYKPDVSEKYYSKTFS